MPPLDDLVAGVLFLGLQLGSLSVIALSAWVFGARTLRRLDPEDSWERWGLATALGLGWIAQSLLVLGLLGYLERTIVLGALALAHLWCWRTWRSLLRRGHRLLRGWRSIGRRPLLAFLALAPCAALALYPPTGFDATLYHLPFVRSFVEAGRLLFLPDLRVPVFPMAVEMDFVLAYFLAGDVAAQLTQLLSMLATASLIFAWGRRSFSRRVGLWAAALWLGVPLVVYLASTAYIDLGMTLFVTAAFSCWERWERSGDQRLLVYGGLCAGLAAGAKYLGLFFCGLLLGLIAARCGRTRSLRPAVLFAIAAALTLAPWYLRILHHTGNPVFPFYPSLFGESEWTIRLVDVHPEEISASPAGDALPRLVRLSLERLRFLLLVPWNAIFDRAVFHWQSPFSPWYLVLLPLGGALAWRRRRARHLLLLAAAYGAFWSLVGFRDLRYLVPILPVLHLALACGVERGARWAEDRFRLSRPAVTWVIAALLLAPGPLYAAYKLHERGRLPVTYAQRSAYLSQQVPGHAAIRWLNDTEGSRYTLYQLYGEHLRYYADGRVLGDWFGRTPYSRILALAHDSRALHEELRRLGAGYFLVLGGGKRLRMPEGEPSPQRFQPVLEEPDFVLYRLRGPT